MSQTKEHSSNAAVTSEKNTAVFRVQQISSQCVLLRFRRHSSGLSAIASRFLVDLVVLEASPDENEKMKSKSG